MSPMTGTTPTGSAPLEATLLVAEVAGIQQWIVGNATELRIIRGGSLLIAEAFAAAEDHLRAVLGPPVHLEGGTQEVAGWQLVARSSGRLLATVPRTSAPELAHRIRALLADHLPGLAVTVGLGPLRTPPLDGETPFDAARRAAREEVLPGATRQPATYHLGTATCDASGVETASRRSTAEGWSLSPASDRRQRADLTDPQLDDVAVERRMDRIGRATLSARFKGYVAVVSADGNAVGARFRDLHSAEEVALESAAVAQGVEEAEAAAYGAAVQLHRQLGGAVPLPANPLIRAGDDLRYVLPAHVALPFAQQLTSASPALPACAGVFFCHASLPFSQSHEAAESLLASAKRASRADGDGTAPFVAFALQSGSGVGDVTLQDRRTASPYRAGELPALLAAASALDTSSSQLRATSEAIRSGGRVAAREWELQWLAATRDQQQQFARLWEALGCDEPVGDHPFPALRDRGGDTQVSPIGDLVLLRQLMSTREDAEAGA